MFDKFIKIYVLNKMCLFGWVLSLIGIMFIGLTLTICGGLLQISPTDLYVGLFFTLGFGLFSGGVALVSIGIARVSIDLGKDSMKIADKSKKIAKDSDDKVNSIANANFLRVVGQIEDLRLSFKETEMAINEEDESVLILPKLITKREIYGWKVVTYIREANEILRECNIRTYNVERFLNIFNKYIEQIKEVKEYFSLEELHHIFIMYERIYDLKKFLNKEERQTANYTDKLSRALSYLREILDESDDKKINLKFIQNYNEIVVTIFNQDNIENRKIIFYSIIDIFKEQYLDIMGK